MRVLFLACARLLLSHAQVCFSRIARMRANGVGNAHAHYYSRDCGLLQSGTLLHHHVRLRGQRCQWVMWGNAWDTGEREISWRQDLWTRTSRKPVAPFSTMAALGYFREISAPSPQNQCWSAVSSLRMRELDFDRALVSKVRVSSE